ncbi:MAG: cyclic pyranopterin monophosphate synthase MoaC [Verrucomicrobiota bacterium]
MDFTHINQNQKPTMVDVSEKAVTQRIAIAESHVRLGPEILQVFIDSGWSSKKGPIIDTAIIAGTIAAKKTSELIPFCHSLNLKSVKIQIEPVDEARLRIEARVKVLDQTGVEMEALTAASVAALTIYDMCKAVSKDIVIESTHLLSKTGGKSDFPQPSSNEGHA